MDQHPLTPLLAPRSLIVLTQPEGQRSPQAQRLLAALKAQRYLGELAVADVQRSGTLAELARTRADLALLALPPEELPGGVELAARMGCRAALALGGGVKGEDAAQLRDIAAREGLHLLGPNTLGLQNPALGLNASVLGPLATPGSLALVSQSGALTATLLDWAAGNNVGFSQVVSVGPHSPVDVAELLMYLADDVRTHSIVLHVEAVVQARAFMSALRVAASVKPVLVLKTGRRDPRRDSAQTHSAVLAERDAVFDAALRRVGAVRVDTFVELFAAARVLGSPLAVGRTVGRRLALVSNGGGPGVLGADQAERVGLSLSRWVDVPQPPQGAVDFADPVRALQNDAEVDAVLVVHAPLPGADPEASAQALAALRPQLAKPLLTCWLGEGSAEAARATLGEVGIPSFRTPESAVSAFAHLAAYHANQRLLQQTPYPMGASAPADVAGARLLVDNVLAQRRTVLTEMESKALLAAFHIPVTATLRARSAHEAMMIATQLGFPVALKIDAEGVPHKSDVDGVVLGLRDAAAVRDAYDALLARVRHTCPDVQVHGATVQPMAGQRHARELHVGLKHEPPFGPVIVFGAGGTEVELMADVAMELPPLNRFLARQLVQRARVARALGPWRGAEPVAMEALEALLLRVSEMACELPQLREMDINPVLADERGVVAVDARIVLAPEVQAPGSHGHQHLAIRPYPAGVAQWLSLRDGTLCSLRAIRPDDAPMLQALVASLSPESRYNRFAATLTELSPAMLARFTLIDYDREMALVAVRAAAPDGSEPERIVGVSRYTLNPGGRSAEFALLVSDAFSGQGLGKRLMESLLALAREQGLARLDGLVLCKNSAMLKLVRGLGFSVKPFDDDEDFKFVSKPLAG